MVQEDVASPSGPGAGVSDRVNTKALSPRLYNSKFLNVAAAGVWTRVAARLVPFPNAAMTAAGCPEFLTEVNAPEG